MHRYLFGWLALMALGAPHAAAATIFESGTLGPTGVTWDELSSQAVPGTNISSFAFNGARFQLTEPVLTTEIGGHFVAPTSGTFFGAIVALEDGDDFPNSDDLSTPDVLGTTLLNFPTSSADVYANLSLSLDRGWYALVFGSGLFGATTNGGAVRNGMDIGDPQYIAHGLNLDWYNLDIFGTFFDNHHFVVGGIVVPEPSTFCASLLMLAFLSRFRVK